QLSSPELGKSVASSRAAGSKVARRGKWPRLQLRGWRDGAEQTIGLVIGTGSEVERIGTGISAAAQGQHPQPVDHDRLLVDVTQNAKEIPVGIECVYPTIAEIADQDIAAEPAKGERCPCDAPGRIQMPAAGEAPQ